MSVPPEVIHVKRLKRKAGDDQEDIVNYLRVESESRKRHRSEAFVYLRSIQNNRDEEKPAVHGAERDAVPTIHSSKPGDGTFSARELESAPVPQPESVSDSVTAAGLPTTTDTSSATKPSSPTEPRRFHFSRRFLTPTSLLTANLSTGKRSRLNTPTTVFVERGHKRTRTEDVHMKDADATSPSADADTEDPPRKHKLPGADRKGPVKPAVQARKKEIPASMNKEYGDDMDEITRNMNDFALQVIGENLAKIEERDRKEAAALAKRREASSAGTPDQRFKPKPPPRRFAERHPEIVQQQQEQAAKLVAAANQQEEYESASEDEYIVETYIRVPASSLSKDVDPEKVGLLVFDNEPDADLFYTEEGDSDDDWLEDDEDENAENYYTADYPDDEVDSDDEYDRSAYHYRTGNASDLEEYDERDGDYVLDYGDGNDDDASTVPSARVGLQPPHAFRDGLD